MTKNKVVSRTPCPECRSRGLDRKGNNLVTYSDTSAYCFSCKYTIGSPSTNYDPVSLDYKYTLSIPKEHTPEGPVTKQYVEHRGVSPDTMRFFGVQTDVDEQDNPVRQWYPYGKVNKYRSLTAKEFRYVGGGIADAQPLFGMDRFQAGANDSITIVEGELDALSVYQMFGGKRPVVSVHSAQCARENCARAHDYLNSFKRIYLCFDNDQPGQDAVDEVRKLFDVNKVYHVKLTKHKDPNDFLTAQEEFVFRQNWENSKPIRPKGILADYSSIHDLLSTAPVSAVASYPFPSLEQITYGIRLGELVLFTAQEKVGKTEIMRAIEYHLCKTTDENIGIIHLEEGERRAVQGLVGYELGKPVHLPDAGVTVEEQDRAYANLTKRDGRVHFYAHYGSDDPNTILDIVRYLVTVSGCKYLFLDHITMLVTGFEGDDERKKLDYLSTRLAMMTKELNFTLFLVSHVNDEGKTRGSRNISKVADLIVHLDRNLEGSTLDERNTTSVVVKGNRFAGKSGPAGYLWFDEKTYRIAEKVLEKRDEFDTAGF
jgi:twinkle protein